MTGSFEQVRLHVVTGKGGTGKTTVATALALAMASAGRHVLLAEVEQRNGIEHVLGLRELDHPELDHVETLVAEFDGGGRLSAVAIDPRKALQEYLEKYYRLGLAGRLVDRAGAVDFAASIAPGLRDVLLSGKVYEATKRCDDRGRPAYDAVVLDAPPTGRVTHFLNVSAEISGLAKVGPVHEQALSMQTLLRSAQTAVHLVTLPEEMPVAETLEAIEELLEIGLQPGAIVLNQLHDPVLTLTDLRKAGRDALNADLIRDGLAHAGIDLPDETAAALIADAARHLDRIALQRQQEARLKESGLPLVRLPFLSDGVDGDRLHALAAALAKGGLAAEARQEPIATGTTGSREGKWAGVAR